MKPISRLLVLLSGLVLAQSVFTLLVFDSNRCLLDTVSAIQAAGFLSIPNTNMMPGLNRLSTAFMGGLFFTFTLGAGLTMGAYAGAWIWDRLLKRGQIALLALITLWIGSVFILNSRGLLFYATLSFLFIPPLVFFLTLKIMVRPPEWPPRLLFLIHFSLGVILISGIVLSGNNFFINFRDRLLLSNPAGTALNDFYYRYTLYAAQAFKALNQKALRTFKFEKVLNPSEQGRVQACLIRNDYLPLSHSGKVDLTITATGGKLIFIRQGQKICQSSLADFLSRPAFWLNRFSSATDRCQFFRYLTFIALMAGLPALIYALCCLLLSFLLNLFRVPLKTASLLSPALVALGGMLLLVMVAYVSKDVPADEKALIRALESNHVRLRIAGLKSIDHHKIDILDYARPGTLLKSPYIAERYWTVRALQGGRSDRTDEHLLAMLNDPHPNVVCQAFYVLGQRDNKAVVPELIRRIKKSHHWYVQWYAYRALKRLGWTQTVSK